MSQLLPESVGDRNRQFRADGAMLPQGLSGHERTTAPSPTAELDGQGSQAGRLEQLLVAPFRVAIAPAATWSPDKPCVPSTALPLLLTLVRAQFGGQAAEFDVAVAEARTPAVLLALGGRLWPAAGRVLQATTCPPRWVSEAGLCVADVDAVRTAVAQLLLFAPRLETFVAQCDPARPPPEPRHVRAVLDELARVGTPGFRLGLVVLLRRCPRQENLAALALSTGRSNDDLQEAASSAATHVLDAAVTYHQNAAQASASKDGESRSLPPRELAQEIVQVTALTRCLDAMVALRPLSRMQREVGRKRVILQAVCLDRFEACIDRHLLRPLASTGPRNPEAIAALARIAAELGEVAAALRQLGDRHGTERAIQKAGQQVRALLDGLDPHGALTQPLLAHLSGARC